MKSSLASTTALSVTLNQLQASVMKKKLLNKVKNMGKKDRQSTTLIFFRMKKISHKIKR